MGPFHSLHGTLPQPPTCKSLVLCGERLCNQAREAAGRARAKLRSVPDLERSLSRLHAGAQKTGRNMERVVLYEDHVRLPPPLPLHSQTHQPAEPRCRLLRCQHWRSCSSSVGLAFLRWKSCQASPLVPPPGVYVCGTKVALGGLTPHS